LALSQLFTPGNTLNMEVKRKVYKTRYLQGILCHDGHSVYCCSSAEVMAMMRMIFEIAMVLAIIGGLFFVTKVLAKENRLNDENEGQDGED
jgi:hypothetical protein